MYDFKILEMVCVAAHFLHWDRGADIRGGENREVLSHSIDLFNPTHKHPHTHIYFVNPAKEESVVINTKDRGRLGFC